ncbi:MAG: hypothetical protein AAGB01_10050 [Cyanobacteria bacterium P01_F01_bin.42]
MGTQSKAKTIFLLASMVGWLVIGGAIIYAGPLFFDMLAHSETSSLWLNNLRNSDEGYAPIAALRVAGVLFVLEVVAYWLWYTRFDKSVTAQLEK